MGNDAKQALIEALDTDFSAELLAVLDRKFPVVNTVSVPTTVDDAIIITGQVNANFNNQFLLTLSGLPVYELLLKAGQLNKVFQDMLLSGLQYSGDTAIGSIIAPKQGGVYYGYFDGWQVTTERETPQAVNISCNGQIESMSNSGGLWKCAFPIPVGSHTAVVSMVYANAKTSQESVSFRVLHWEDMPASLSESDGWITIDVGDSADMIDACTLEIDGVPVKMTKQARQFILQAKQDQLEAIAQLDRLPVKMFPLGTVVEFLLELT